MRDKAYGKREASFHTLVEIFASPVFVSGGKWFHYVNHAAEAITGRFDKGRDACIYLHG